MSTLLFVEILRERGIAAQWFDVRKIMRTNDRFGRAEPDIAALSELTQQLLAPRLAEGVVITRALLAAKPKAAPPRLAAAAATIPPRYSAKR
jgi:aspartate kinase